MRRVCGSLPHERVLSCMTSAFCIESVAIERLITTHLLPKVYFLDLTRPTAAEDAGQTTRPPCWRAPPARRARFSATIAAGWGPERGEPSRNQSPSNPSNPLRDAQDVPVRTTQSRLEGVKRTLMPLAMFPNAPKPRRALARPPRRRFPFQRFPFRRFPFRRFPFRFPRRRAGAALQPGDGLSTTTRFFLHAVDELRHRPTKAAYGTRPAADAPRNFLAGRRRDPQRHVVHLEVHDDNFRRTRRIRRKLIAAFRSRPPPRNTIRRRSHSRLSAARRRRARMVFFIALRVGVVANRERKRSGGAPRGSTRLGRESPTFPKCVSVCAPPAPRAPAPRLRRRRDYRLSRRDAAAAAAEEIRAPSFRARLPTRGPCPRA